MGKRVAKKSTKQPENNNNNNINIISDSNENNENNENNIISNDSDIDIDMLISQLDEEKKKNNILNNRIVELENELAKEKKININLNNIINQLKNKSKDLNSIQNSKEFLFENLIEKEKEIKELKTKLSRFPFELNEGDKLISLNFTSSNQEIHYSIICKNNDFFNNVENKLYEHYPKYSETENYFIVNGKKINRYKRLNEINIKSNDIIVLNIIDN